MGAKVTVFENRSSVEMEIRIFIPPARPDRYKKIFRIKPGEMKGLKIRSLCSEEINSTTYLMFFMDGEYSVSLYPYHVKKYAKIFGYVDESGEFLFKGVRTGFPCFLRLIYQVSSGATAFGGKCKGAWAKTVRYSTKKRQATIQRNFSCFLMATSMLQKQKAGDDLSTSTESTTLYLNHNNHVEMLCTYFF